MVRLYKTKNIMPHFVTEYMDDLLTEVLKIEEPRSSLESRLHSTPPPLCASFTKPNKEDAVAEHQSRFSN